MIKKWKHQIHDEQLKYQSYLTKKGLRFTTGRQIVFEEAMDAHGHFATEELVKQCRTNKRNISRATVYRCIRELLEASIIRETAFGEKHQHYEHMYDEQKHHHARCIRCNTQIEFPDLGEDKMYQSVMKKLKFKVLGHEMHFYGLCQKCDD